MSSSTSTPQCNRRCLDATRIPQLSPNVLRRSLSLRLRVDSGGSFSSISPSSPTNSVLTKQNNICGKENNKSKSVSFSSMAHMCNNKKESPNGTPDKTIVAPAAAVDATKHNNYLANSRDNELSPLNFSNCDSTNSTPRSHPQSKARKTANEHAKLTPDSPIDNGYLDDDLDSLYSYTSIASGRSTMSSCEHPFVARNGTTFSGRKMKYVVHCSSYAGQTGEDYLTPTQRAQKHIRRLKCLLAQARLDLEQKDSEILRLTKEVVDLRLFKASLNSPEERSNSSDAVTVRENNEPKTSQDVSPIIDITDIGIKSSTQHAIYQPNLNPFLEQMCSSEMQSSFSDSGHFEDITTSSVNSKDSFVQTHDIACGSDIYDQRLDLIKMYEHKIEELIRCHDTETQQVKISYNDKVEALLQKLADCNTRYADLVPDYEQAKERIRELEKQLDELQQKLEEQEDKQNKMYLHMYAKGQEAERISHADKVLEFAQHASNRVSVPELMQQLQVTQNELENMKDGSYMQENGGSHVLLSAKEAISLWLLGARKTMYRRLIDAQQTKNKVDPEVTLQFLKSAIYYFLTDKENTQGHLNAIESILGFSECEKLTIDRARAAK